MSEFRIIGASAGTGKTHRLTSLVVDACRGREGPRVAPEALVGVTFTKKAAGELAERIRAHLYAAGEPDLAQRLGMAWLGTMHAVGLRLVAEHAIEVGLSPEIGILPEDGDRFLHALLERVVPEDRQRALDALAARLRIRYDARIERVDWAQDVFDALACARNNGIGVDALAPMAERSWATLAALLDPIDETRDLDGELLAAIDAAARAIDGGSDATAGTAKAREALRKAPEELATGVWAPWSKLAKLEATKASRAAVEPVQAAAARVLAHPRLHADLRAYIAAIHATAADVLRAFAEWKAAAHVVDHADQLELARRVLDDPAIAGRLREELDLLVVDELQDSSPLQVAFFMRLHAICGRSAWVGDAKQCIFEWNGADPALLDIVLRAIRERGGAVERLDTNRRSRPELVELASELFASAFAAHGIAPDDVRVSPFRVDPPELAALPPVAIAPYPQREGADAIAGIVAGLLAAPAATPVVDRANERARPLEPGDIAVLVATNDGCRAIAKALAELGIRAASARDGALRTPEGRALHAGLTLLVAPDDAIAELELEVLCGGAPDAAAAATAREGWLVARIGAVRAGDRGPGAWARALAPVRDALAALSPAAAAERVIDVLDLGRVALGWPDPEQRLANLDALRALVAGYEALERARERPLTVSGLLRACAQIAAKDEDMPLRDDQHVTEGARAVTVTTYHKAKGLEWPVVVLADLDRRKDRSPFEVACESDEGAFSLADPLASRWVRTWPWPFAPQRTGALYERARASAIGAGVLARDAREKVRLLYVGVTRARDHLVFAIPEDAKGNRSTAWLDTLADADGPVLALDGDPERELVVRTVDGAPRAFRTRRVVADSAKVAEAHVAAFARAGPQAYPPRAFAPSSAEPADIGRLGARAWRARGSGVRLGDALAVQTPDAFDGWDRIGTAVHGYLAGDGPSATDPEHDDARRERAARWIAAHAVGDHVGPDALCEAGARLRAFVAERWPDASWHTEIPIACDVDDGPHARRVRGTIDLLLDTPAGWVLVDHKSFPAHEAAAARANELAPQLALYAHALERVGDRRVAEVWIHFPIAGVVVPLRPA